MENLQAGLGLVCCIAVAWFISEKRHLSWRLILGGLLFQGILAALVFQWPWLAEKAAALNGVVTALQAATDAGSALVFGYLGGGPAPFETVAPTNNWILAFRGLMLIPVLGALSALLFYWRILPLVVKGFARLLGWTFGMSGALGFGVAANVFMGMVESPLAIRPYLQRMPRSDLFVLMVTGMSTVAGTVLVLYATFMSQHLDNALLHLLTASFMSCPASILLARLAVPPQETALQDTHVPQTQIYHSNLDAIAAGTQQGMQLFFNVLFILVAMTALVYLGNVMLGLLPMVGDEPLTFQRILGWLFMPLAWLLGIPWAECAQAGSLLGTKVVLNELLAYLDMSQMPLETFSPRSRIILVYALCSFANLGSLGIMIAGLNSMIPERRQEILALGGRSLLLGFLAGCMTGAVAGLLF